MTGSLAGRLEEVRGRIGSAARLAGRDPDSITLIVVTKFHPVALLHELTALGVRDFGENRHQEAQQKAAQLAASGEEVRWHFLGRLQTNKARHVLSYASVLHSVDRPRLVDALDAAPPPAGENPPAGAALPPTPCFVQVSLDGDPARGGVPEDRVEALAERVCASRRLRLLGVMAVAPLGADPDASFAALHEISLRVRRIDPSATAISAGMSHDFEAAIAHGATHLRIGTAITGNRPPRG